MFLLVCGIEKNVVGASLMPAIASTPQLAVTVIGKYDVQIQLNYRSPDRGVCTDFEGTRVSLGRVCLFFT